MQTFQRLQDDEIKAAIQMWMETKRPQYTYYAHTVKLDVDDVTGKITAMCEERPNHSYVPKEST